MSNIDRSATLVPAVGAQVERGVRCHRGATRWVLLVCGLALKVPRTTTWRTFLNGLLANMQEREFSRTGWPELCPVRFSVPGGWLVVMDRARPLDDAEWCDFEPELFTEHPDYTIPVEPKQDSFGVLAGRVVAVDYGT